MEARSATVTTILILEDNPIVRQMLAVVLRSKGGYRVLEASAEDEAIAHVERHAEEIDLLLADVFLDNLSGRTIADRLARKCAAMRVLFISGYPKEHLVENGWLEPSDAFLAKPFPPDRLMRALKDVLGESHPPHILSLRDVQTACARGAA